jgi:hypothetical protein
MRVLATLGFLTLGLVGCAVGGYEGGGTYYDGGADVGYGVDFYEPYGYAYGGWGRGYHVGPPRHDGGFPGDRLGGHPPGVRGAPHSGRPPAYHRAPSSRPVPSIPSGPRGGGHGGGRPR